MEGRDGWMGEMDGGVDGEMDGWLGWMGWGWTVHQRGPLIFFIRYIKDDMYIKKCPDKFLVGLKFWSSWGPNKKNQNALSRLDFLRTY